MKEELQETIAEDKKVLFKKTVITSNTVYYKKNNYIIPENVLKTIDKEYYEVLEE